MGLGLELGLGAAGAIAGMFGGGKKYDPNAINQKYINSKAVGYLTPEDYAQGERFKARANQAAGTLARGARAKAISSLTARGLESSPVAARVGQQIGQQEGDAIQQNELNTESYLNNLRTSREAFERQKIMTAWGSELGADRLNFEREMARNAQFWNYAGNLAGDLAGYFRPSGGIVDTPISSPTGGGLYG